MKKIKVDVTVIDSYYNKTYYAKCSLGRGKGKETLIEFWQWQFSSEWAFDTKRVLGSHGGFWNGTNVRGPEFPVEYFKRLCQAVWILKTHDTEFPEVEFSVGTKKLLNIQ